jgi:hypothetical protein
MEVLQVGVFTDALLSSSACLRLSGGKHVVPCRKLAATAGTNAGTNAGTRIVTAINPAPQIKVLVGFSFRAGSIPVPGTVFAARAANSVSLQPPPPRI